MTSKQRPLQHLRSLALVCGSVGAVLALSACAEKAETGHAIRHDAPMQAGTGSNFVHSGWQPGDRASWEAQLKARQQYGQNEYTRVNIK